MIANEYMFLQRLGRLVTTANSSSNKKTLALFVDKIDQAMREPNSESPLSCDQCSKENSVSICSNSKKSHSYCSQEGEGSCPGRVRCCYGCENYSDNYAGHYSRIDENAPLSKAHYNYWQQLQLALIEAAVDIRDDFNGLIKVMYSVRLEACNYSENVWGEQRAKIMSSVCILSYSRDELKKYIENVLNIKKKNCYTFPSLQTKRIKRTWRLWALTNYAILMLKEHMSQFLMLYIGILLVELVIFKIMDKQLLQNCMKSKLAVLTFQEE